MTATDLDLDGLLDALLDRARARPVPPLVNAAGVEVTPYATTGRLVVNSGDTILASWGNTTFDQSVECFASAADRDAQWPAPHAGAVCFTVDANTLWLYVAAWQPLSGSGRPPVTTGSSIQSQTDALGQMWVAKNGVFSGAWKLAREVLGCAYHRNAGFSTTLSPAVIPMDAVELDPFTIYNWQTGVGTIPISGRWRIDGAVAAQQSAAGQFVGTQINVNGTIVRNAIVHTNANAWCGANTTYLGALHNADQVTISGNSAVTLNGSASGNTWIQMQYVGSG